METVMYKVDGVHIRIDYDAETAFISCDDQLKTMIGINGEISIRMLKAFVRAIRERHSKIDCNVEWLVLALKRQPQRPINYFNTMTDLYLWAMSDPEIEWFAERRFTKKDGIIYVHQKPVGYYGNELMGLPDGVQEEGIITCRALICRGKRLRLVNKQLIPE